MQRADALYLRVTYQHFCQVWREDPDLSKIHLRRTHRFMKCDLCVQLRTSLKESYLSGVSFHLKRLRQLYLDHLRSIKAARGAYWMRRRAAALKPHESLSLCIDGSDQVNNGCPYYSEKTHAMEGSWKFRLHVYGVLVHGRRPYVYLVQDHVKQGNACPFGVLSCAVPLCTRSLL